MSDPVRLVSAATSQAARALLRDARMAAPPGLKERALSASLQAFAAPGASAGAGAAKASSLVNVHWVGVACVAGGLAAGGMAALRVQGGSVSADTRGGEPGPAPRLKPGTARAPAGARASAGWGPGPVALTSVPAV